MLSKIFVLNQNLNQWLSIMKLMTIENMNGQKSVSIVWFNTCNRFILLKKKIRELKLNKRKPEIHLFIYLFAITKIA